MDFLTQEIIEKAGLTEDQLATIKPLGESYIADLKKGWDGKANSDAEGILNGAAVKVAEVTKVTRNQGEKIADYIVRAGNEHLSVKHFSALRNSFSPSRRHWRHFGSRLRAIFH
jgi:hypothetical protein